MIASLPYMTLLGGVALVANIALSFEEPHREMLLVSALLIAAAPLGLVLHLAVTHELTPDEKRRWMAGLMSRRGPELFGAYFSSVSRRWATDRLLPQAGSQDAKHP
jgi:hypothetical protein